MLRFVPKCVHELGERLVVIGLCGAEKQKHVGHVPASLAIDQIIPRR
jgi:hypothetical protein